MANRDFVTYRISNRTRMLVNNCVADTPEQAAEQTFRQVLNRRDVVPVKTGPGAQNGNYYAAYERKGSELVAIRRVQSLLVQPLPIPNEHG